MIITQTPLRISFLGGGTDFRDFFQEHGGCVVTTAIDKYVYCIIKKRFDKKIYINWSEKEIVDSVDEIKHELVREAMKKTGVTDGVEISFMSDIPASGSGLGSSSTVTVGVLNALYQYTGHPVGTKRLAEEACEIEIDILGKPIGVQDQYIAALGGVQFLDFSADGVKGKKLKLTEELQDDLSNYMMAFFTGKTRQADVVLTEQKQKIADKTDILKQMAQQAKEAKKLLEKGKIKEVGKLLDEGWQLKKQLASKISNSEINTIYEAAKKAGAIGGKISGAGGGGFLTLFVPTNKRGKVRKALKGLREMPFGLSNTGTRVIFNIHR